MPFAAGALYGQVNLILNGSFEVGGKTGVWNFPDWDQIGPASNHSDYGVAQSSGSADMAEQGNFFAYFHGHPTDNSQDCLGQTVHWTVGADYTISYSLGTDGPTTGAGAAMWVVVGTSFGIDLNQDVMLTAYLPNSSTALPYRRFTTNYTARAATEILSFHAVDAASSILLDDVSVTLAAPRLELGYGLTNTLIFSWTLGANGFRLQSSPSLDAVRWATLTNVPTPTASGYRLILPATAGRQFYRLTLP